MWIVRWTVEDHNGHTGEMAIRMPAPPTPAQLDAGAAAIEAVSDAALVGARYLWSTRFIVGNGTSSNWAGILLWRYEPVPGVPAYGLAEIFLPIALYTRPIVYDNEMDSALLQALSNILELIYPGQNTAVLAIATPNEAI